MAASVPLPAAERSTTHRSPRNVRFWERSNPLELPLLATIRAFLGYFLKGQKQYTAFLAENHWPDTMTWDAKNAPDKR